MSAVVRQETIFFLVCILTGILLVWSYDIFRIFRRFVPHHTIAVSVEDLIYWFAVSLVIFGVIFEENHGVLRGFALAGILIGVWIQWYAESFFRKTWIKLLKKIKKGRKMTTSGR